VVVIFVLLSDGIQWLLALYVSSMNSPYSTQPRRRMGALANVIWVCVATHLIGTLVLLHHSITIMTGMTSFISACTWLLLVITPLEWKLLLIDNYLWGLNWMEMNTYLKKFREKVKKAGRMFGKVAIFDKIWPYMSKFWIGPLIFEQINQISKPWKFGQFGDIWGIMRKFPQIWLGGISRCPMNRNAEVGTERKRGGRNGTGTEGKGTGKGTWKSSNV
jgi:hypothetical protein